MWRCKGPDPKLKPQLRLSTRRAAQGVPAEEAAKDEGIVGQAPKPAPPKPPPAAPAARDAPAALPALAERCPTCLHRMALTVVAYARPPARLTRAARGLHMRQGCVLLDHCARCAGTG